MIPFDLLGDDFRQRADRLADLQAAARDAREQHEAAQAALEQAKRDDLRVQADARRAKAAGEAVATPKLTEPAARKRLDTAAREVQIADAAATGEAAEFALHVSENREAIEARSRAAERELGERAADLLEELRGVLRGRSEARAVRPWLDRPVDGATIRGLGNLTAGGESEITAIFRLLEGERERDERAEHDQNWSEWEQLVAQAKVAAGPLDPEDPTIRERIDAAIDAEVERRREAGEPVPRPTSLRWVRKLGVGQMAASA